MSSPFLLSVDTEKSPPASPGGPSCPHRPRLTAKTREQPELPAKPRDHSAPRKELPATDRAKTRPAATTPDPEGKNSRQSANTRGRARPSRKPKGTARECPRTNLHPSSFRMILQEPCRNPPYSVETHSFITLKG